MKWASLKASDPDVVWYWNNVDPAGLDEGAYAHPLMTRPQTLSCAITDSPAGLAAWIVEMWRAWSGVVQFTEYAEGGRFAIYGRADEMAEDLRRFCRPLRERK
jgi:hypothetical protein